MHGCWRIDGRIDYVTFLHVELASFLVSSFCLCVVLEKNLMAVRQQ